jgi:apolipoprotein N-acyltransferase
MFANLSNIGWFGDTIAIAQHLQISRARALEFQRPMLRATNTGATVVIDHRGQVTHGLRAHTRGVLEAAVQGRDGLTPFAWWASRYSLWPLLVFAVAVLALLRKRPVVAPHAP